MVNPFKALRTLDGVPRAAVEVGPLVEFHFTDGIAARQQAFPVAGAILEQHVHAFDHTTYIPVGEVRVWRADCPEPFDYRGPCGILIRAGVEHKIMILQPGTIVLCLLNEREA
ncbi:MAG TPA: hypothetical protein VGM15_03215 [Burkholderiaceae bacterium]|jgi:hypothetical protein